MTINFCPLITSHTIFDSQFLITINNSFNHHQKLKGFIGLPLIAPEPLEK